MKKKFLSWSQSAIEVLPFFLPIGTKNKLPRSKILVMQCTVSIILLFTSCHKNIDTIGSWANNELANKVSTWLDKQKRGTQNSNQNTVQNYTEKAQSSTNTGKNANIDLLKNSLDYESALQSDISHKYNYIVVPIHDDIKAKKHVDASASLALVLITDKAGKIVSGHIGCYIPKDGKPRGSKGAGIVAAMLKGKAPADSGMLKVMDVSGRWLHQIAFTKGSMSSYGVITNKKDSSSKSTSYVSCLDWYLVTTYYDQNGNIVGQTSEYVGSSCSGCDDSSYMSLCPSGEGGGGDGTSETPVYSSEDISASTDEFGDFSESGGPSAPGFEPPVHIHGSAKKDTYELFGLDWVYKVTIYPALITNPDVDYISSNGNNISRSAFISSQNYTWGLVYEPVIWVRWSGVLHKEYTWYGGQIFEVAPWTLVKIQ